MTIQSADMTDTERMDWLERFGCERFSRNSTTRNPMELWFDCMTDGSDYAPDLRSAIDRARAALASKQDTE